MSKEDKKGMFNGKYLSNTTLISTNTNIKGDVECTGDIRIDGKIEGNITASGKVVIGDSGIINGNINADNTDIIGSVVGDVMIKDKLCLLENSSLKGDIKAKHLEVEKTASFNGMCVMEEQVKK